MRPNFRINVRKVLTWILKERQKFGLTLILGILIYWIHRNQSSKTKVPVATNYFANYEKYLNRSYLFNSPTCNILNKDPFDSTILPILKQESSPPLNCDQKVNKNQLTGKWTYTNGSNLIFNTTALREDGFSFDYLDCCYIHFERVTQSITNYDEFADSIVKRSKDCVPIPKAVTQIQHPFIRVICGGRWPVSPVVLYREYHPLPLDNSIVQKRSNYWKSLPKTQPKPPNIFLIGLDSTSRLNFLRNMPKTKQVLLDRGFIEFLGYTKVGENTHPNSVAFLSGYSLEDITKMCMFTDWTAQDNCPYIWKRFQNANYLTGSAEDYPNICGFHYDKTGFVHEPVEFYLRPFFLGAQQNDPLTLEDNRNRCIGSKTSWEIVLKYVNDLKALASEKEVPLFLHSWITSMAHGHLSGAKDGDETYAEFFKNFEYTNSIVIFLGDHGFRFGKIRETFIGWYEDKLPLFWIYLPESFRLLHPGWYTNLQENAKRLTTPFDFFHTMSHVLNEYTGTSQIPVGTFFEKDGSLTSIPRIYGESLFNPISINRTCDEAGIPSSYCACYVPQSVSVNDKDLNLAAQAAVQSINNMLTHECVNQTLVKVISGAVVQKGSKTSGTYIVGFETKPGNFLFEAQVHYSKGTNRTEFKAKKNILRMNKMSTDVSCAKGSELSRFCYCKFLT